MVGANRVTVAGLLKKDPAAHIFISHRINDISSKPCLTIVIIVYLNRNFVPDASYVVLCMSYSLSVDHVVILLSLM